MFFQLVYSISVQFFGLVLFILSFFNKKAAKLLKSQTHWIARLKENTRPDARYIWIHCASAGEFEQAIPLIDEFKKKNDQILIAVSFFSPSGFELYKNSNYAAIFFYFPLDTRRNISLLLSTINPIEAIFIKNEIWWNTLNLLKENNIPSFLINAVQPNSGNVFYQYYLNKSYSLFTKIFYTKDFGNTKIERVLKIKQEAFSDVILEDFCKDSLTIYLGSSWKTEESLIALFYKSHFTKYPNLKLVIAPHEYDNTTYNRLCQLFSDYQHPNEIDVISYSNYTLESNKRVLFLDKKGILKFAYRYATLAFIGGGFSKSVHNISEAAVYGIPTLFGPEYTKYEENIEMVNIKAAFPVTNYSELEGNLNALLKNESNRAVIKQQLDVYFYSQKNSAEKIIEIIYKII